MQDGGKLPPRFGGGWVEENVVALWNLFSPEPATMSSVFSQWIHDQVILASLRGLSKNRSDWTLDDKTTFVQSIYDNILAASDRVNAALAGGGAQSLDPGEMAALQNAAASIRTLRGIEPGPTTWRTDDEKWAEWNEYLADYTPSSLLQIDCFCSVCWKSTEETLS